MTDTFGDSSRYSNRSLARPAMGLAVVFVTYLVIRLRVPRLRLRIVAWPFAAFACYLVVGAVLLAISLIFHAIT